MSLDFSFYRRLLDHHQWNASVAQLPPSKAQWLFHSQSLTQKLQKICSHVAVDVVQEGWQTALPEPYWLREVVIKCGDTPWIFAQTRLPQTTVHHVAAPTLSLGNRALGLWLFPQHPTRLNLEWQCIHGLYARRSTLTLQGYPLEIKELFLKDFPFDYDEPHHFNL